MEYDLQVRRTKAEEDRAATLKMIAASIHQGVFKGLALQPGHLPNCMMPKSRPRSDTPERYFICH